MNDTFKRDVTLLNTVLDRLNLNRVNEPLLVATLQSAPEMSTSCLCGNADAVAVAQLTTDFAGVRLCAACALTSSRGIPLFITWLK